MATIKIAKCLLSNPVIFDIIVEAFEEFKEIERDCNDTVTFRVDNDEIRGLDRQICPLITSFPGIKPFILAWDE